MDARRGCRSIVFSMVLLALGLSLGGCGPSVHLEGELVIYVQSGEPTEERHGSYALLLDSGVERDLHFRADPDLTPAVRLEVWGDEEPGGAIRVERYRVVRLPQPQTAQP